MDRIIFSLGKTSRIREIFCGLRNCLDAKGHETRLWDTKISAFDIFDLFNPDTLYIDSASIERDLVKILKEYPKLNVKLFISSKCEDVKKHNYLLKLFLDKTNITTFYSDVSREDSILINPAADLTRFSINEKNIDSRYICDIACVANYNKENDKIFKEKIEPLIKDKSFRLFGYKPWDNEYYISSIGSNEQLAKVFRNSKVTLFLNIDDDIPVQWYNCIACGGLPILASENFGKKLNNYHLLYKEQLVNIFAETLTDNTYENRLKQIL